MDFNPRLLHAFPSNIPLPFYLAYPGYQGGDSELTVMRDMEYLQQTYPIQVREYQRTVAQILDKLDYEGSMIYDEYPDKFQLQRLTQTVTNILKERDSDREQATEGIPSAENIEEKWHWLENLIFVLVCDEIYRRRHHKEQYRSNKWNI